MPTRQGRLVRLSAAIVAVALVALGCSPDTAEEDPRTPGETGTETPGGEDTETPSIIAEYNPQPYENIQDGGTLRTAGTYSPQGLPLHTNSDLNSLRVWSWYNPNTIYFSPEGEVNYNEDYFTQVEESEVDGKQVVTITINEEAVFNDGTPIDWRAIHTVWHTSSGVNEEYQSSGELGLRNIESIEEGDTDKQAVLTFTNPDPWWPRLFQTVVHPDLADPEIFNQGYVDQARPEYGAGPFTIGEFNTQTGNITYVRNDNWWGRPAKLDQRILVNLETDAAVNAFINGELDYTSTGTAEGLSRITGVEGTEIRYSSSPFVYKLILNAQSEPLQDPVVRQAIFQTVDRQQIHDIVFQGLDHEEPLPGSNVIYFFQEEYEDNVAEVAPFDPEAAAALLDGAGYEVGDDGVRVSPDGVRLELEFPNTSTSEIQAAWISAVAQQLEGIGIQLNVNPTSSSEWNAIIEERRFDVWTVGQRSSSPYGFFDSLENFYRTDAPNNLSSAGSEELDDLFDTTQVVADPVAAAELANEIERQGLANFGWLPLYSGPSIYGVSEGLANFGGVVFYQPLPETVGWVEEG